MRVHVHIFDTENVEMPLKWLPEPESKPGKGGVGERLCLELVCVNYGNICILHMCYFNYIESHGLCNTKKKSNKVKEKTKKKNGATAKNESAKRKSKEKTWRFFFFFLLLLARQPPCIQYSRDLAKFRNRAQALYWVRPLAAITNSLISNSTFSRFALCTLIDVVCAFFVTHSTDTILLFKQRYGFV